MYSNIAFTILMYAVSEQTGKNYTELVRELSTALNMPSTRPSPGDDALAVIPPMANTWGSDYGDSSPGGGLVSTLADLSSFLHAILSRSPALAPTTRIRYAPPTLRAPPLTPPNSAWLKPHSFSGSPTTAVGSPWEIFRPPPSLLFPTHNPSDPTTPGRTITIHSKDGAAYGYHARIALLDDYGLGLAVLSAGDAGALGPVLDAAYSVVVPALDAAAREQAAARYAGVFVGRGGDGSNATVAADGQGLRLVGLARDGKDVMAAFGEVWRTTMVGFLPPEVGAASGVYRAYPAEVEREGTGEGGRRVVEEDWRVERGMEVGALETDLPGRGISDGDCKDWTLADWMYYGGQPLDRLVFVRNGETGEVVGLEVPFLRTGVMRKVRGV